MHLRYASIILVTALVAPATAQIAADGTRGTWLADGVGYVSMLRLAHQHGASANGELLLAFEQDGMQGIPLYASHDDGEHWSSLLRVTDQPHAGDANWQLRWQPNLAELSRGSGDLATGTLLLAANAGRNDSAGRIAQEDLQLYVSTDGGDHWQYRSSIIQGAGRPEAGDNQGVWEPDVHVLDDGRLVAYYSSEQHKDRGYNQVLAHKVSSDGGRHWSAETLDVAIPGGVQRPGMATVARLPDGRYAMTYENIDGPKNGQVFIKYSRDGLDWGDPTRHGEAVSTAADAWLAACPVLRWFPLGGPDGVLVVSAERAGGGGDEDGHALYWNNALGRGPWWEVRAPVQKRTGNMHAGWTQALLLQPDHRLLQVTSSSSAKTPLDAGQNEILHRSERLDFDRYEAEDAEREAAVAIDDPHASNQRKARLAAMPEGRLRFEIHMAAAGTYRLRVRYAEIDLPGVPSLVVNGAKQSAPVTHDEQESWRIAELLVPLLAGFNTIDIEGGAHALDIDYLQVTGTTTTDGDAH